MAEKKYQDTLGEEPENKLDMIIKLLGSINIKLDKLVNRETIEKPAKKIVETLKQEEIVNHTVEEGEVVLMDLKNVTIMASTEKALLVTKEGLQKWIPKSTILGVFFRDWKEGKILLTDLTGLEDGDYLNEVELTEKGAWIAKKGWDKLEVRKR